MAEKICTLKKKGGSETTIVDSYEMCAFTTTSRLLLYLSADILSHFTQIKINKNNFATDRKCYSKNYEDGVYPTYTNFNPQSNEITTSWQALSNFVTSDKPNLAFMSNNLSSTPTANQHWTILLQ